MKKLPLLTSIVTVLCLTSCTPNKKEEKLPDFVWNEEQLEVLHNQLKGHEIPRPQRELTKFSTYAGYVVAETDFDNTIAEEYSNQLKKESYQVVYHTEYDSYTAKKYINNTEYISVSFAAIDEEEDSFFKSLQILRKIMLKEITFGMKKNWVYLLNISIMKSYHSQIPLMSV